MATPSYRDRMKAARAQARAQREAEKAAWQRRAELMGEVRRLALDAMKAGIRARGETLTAIARSYNVSHMTISRLGV